MLAAYPETIRLLCNDVSGKRRPGYAPSKKIWARRENRRAESDLAVEHVEDPGETCNAMQGSQNATKKVAFCSTDVNRTTGLVCFKYGGEGGIRTHGRVSPTLAFEASSFNRSDTSPRQLHSSGRAARRQRQRATGDTRQRDRKDFPVMSFPQSKWQKRRHTLPIRRVGNTK